MVKSYIQILYIYRTGSTSFPSNNFHLKKSCFLKLNPTRNLFSGSITNYKQSSYNHVTSITESTRKEEVETYLLNDLSGISMTDFFKMEPKPATSNEWYNLVKILSEKKRFFQIIYLYDCFKEEIPFIPKRLFDLFSKAAKETKNITKEVDIIELGISKGMYPKESQINYLLPKLSSSQCEHLLSLIKLEMFKNPSPLLLSNLLKHTKAFDLKEQDFFKDLKKINYSKSSKTIPYNILINAFAKRGQINEVDKLVQEMEAKDIPLDKHTYSALMDAYCRGGHGEKVIGSWESNPYKNLTNSSSYISILLDSYKMNSDLDSLLKAWDDLKKQNYILTTNNYTSYIEGLMKFKQFTLAVKTFTNDMCRQLIVSPDLKTKTNIILSLKQSYRLNGEPKNSKHLIELVENSYKEFLSSNKNN